MISEARRRKSAVEVSAGRGVVGFWVVRKAVSQAEFGLRDFVLLSCAAICDPIPDCDEAILGQFRVTRTFHRRTSNVHQQVFTVRTCGMEIDLCHDHHHKHSYFPLVAVDLSHVLYERRD